MIVSFKGRSTVMHIRKWILSLALLISAILVSIVIGTPSVEAQSLSCANVRCAGSCVDTPSGPVCDPLRQTCASTLCQQGNQCIETQSGPQCVPLSGPNYNDYPPRYNYNAYHYNPRPWRRYWRGHRPSYGGWTPWYDRPVYNGWRHNGWYQPPHYYSPPRADWPNPPTDGIACSMNYDPVCGQKIVQCFRAPCPPLQKTFGNGCSARAEGFSVLSKGVCP